MDQIVIIEFPDKIEWDLLKELGIEVTCSYSHLPIIKAMVNTEQRILLEELGLEINEDIEGRCF